LDRDAILDASSLPDPSNLQSENVQEGWNWTANSYQKRSSGDSDLSRHWTMTTRFDRYPRTVRRLPCEPADRAGWRQAFGMLSDHGRRLPSLQDNLAWPYANTLVPHSRRHSRFGKLAPARLVTLTECTLSFISYAALRHLTRRRYGVAEALWRETLIDAARFRQWIVNVGQRPAISRLAHMVIEMRERLKVIGKDEGDNIEMPLTQEQLGDAMGITPVHFNRV
jgi:hypothetical protein